MSEIRRRLNADVEEQRERLRRIDDQTLAALLDHIRGLYPDPRFDPVGYL